MIQAVLYLLAFILIICIFLGSYDALKEYFIDIKSDIKNSGTVTIQKDYPKYSVNAILQFTNRNITVNYETYEKSMNKKRTNFQVFPENLLIERGPFYYVVDSMKPNIVSRLKFNMDHIGKVIVSDRVARAIQKDVEKYFKRNDIIIPRPIG